MNQREFIDLVIAFLSGTAEEEQRRQLERILAEDPGKRELFESLQQNWLTETEDLPAADAAWEQAEKRMDVPKKRRLISGRVLGYAAAGVVLLLVAGLGKWQQRESAPSLSSVSGLTDYELVSSGESILDSVGLPDGTIVRLNKGSSLRFRKNFDGARREVELKGEAFFQVARRPDQPFELRAGKALITVLGTSFNVKESHGDSVVSVAVMEGKVALADTSSKNNAALLTAGWLGVLEKGNIRTGKTAAENYLSWFHNRLVFEDLPLEEVAHQLEDLYNVEIIVRSQLLSNLKLTADINRGELKDVLSKIGYTLDVKYKFRNNEVLEIYR